MAIENQAGEMHELMRDACGRVTSEKGFDGRVSRLVYDNAGVVTKMRRAGTTVYIARDTMDRVTRVRCGRRKSAFAYR